jgi:hypothetical protein
MHTFWSILYFSPMSVNAGTAARDLLVNRLASAPPSKRRFAVLCSHPGCAFIWYFSSDREALEAGLQHEHPSSMLHIFQYDFSGTKQAPSGFTLYKQRWIELLGFRDDNRRATM